MSSDVNYTLSFFGNKHEAANVEVIEEILTDYMEENKGITISYESIKETDYFSLLKNREQAGKLDAVFRWQDLLGANDRISFWFVL